MRRPRVAQILKLAGTLLCALLLIAMFLNRDDLFDFDNRQLALRLSGGDFAVTWSDTTPLPPKTVFFGLLQTGPRANSREIWHVRYPLWPLFLALLVPTLWLWRIDRRDIRSKSGSPPAPKPRRKLHRKRSRFRRLLKQMASAAFVATALALLISTGRSAALVEPASHCGLGITRGTLLLFYSVMPMKAYRLEPDGLEVESLSWHGTFAGNPLTPRWPRYQAFGANTLKVVFVPLSSLLIALGVTTGCLWLLDFRRTRPELCPECNYNLTGNTSGVCPECGHKCEPAQMPEERPNGKCGAAAVRTAGPAAAASREAATD